MRKLPALVLSGVLVLVLLLTTGCARADGSAEATKGLPSNASQAAEDIRVSVIDVGKGDCILLQSGESYALIDTGYDNTSSTVVSELRDAGVKSLDFLVLTHYDRDHIGGVGAIGKAFNIGTIYLPGYEGADKQYQSATSAVKELKVPTQKVTTVQELKLGKSSLTIYPTSLKYVIEKKSSEGNDNDLSLVTTMTYRDDSYLFAGDLEEEGIEAYLAGDHGEFDVLKMPHHGRKSSNTGELLEAVNPQVAIITDGEDDPADKKTLKLLKEAGIKAYRTSEDGTVVVQSDGSGSYTVTTQNG